MGLTKYISNAIIPAQSKDPKRAEELKEMTINYKKIISFAIILSAFVFVGGFAAPANAKVTCPGLTGYLISKGGNGAPATASVTNGSTNCLALITFSSYKMYINPPNPGWIDTQVMFDSQTMSLAPGETKTFSVNVPPCKAQLDVYEGNAHPYLTDAAGGFPDQNVFIGDFTSGNLCVDTPPRQDLSCSPASQTGNINDTFTFTATGGDGNYSWSSYGGSRTSGTGASFTTQFLVPGVRSATVVSNGQTISCSVIINEQTCNQPTAYVNAATNLTQNSATLNGYVDPRGKSTTYYFEYGTSQSYGYSTNSQTISSAQNVSFSVYNLQQNTTYYYRLVVQSECGNNRTSNSSFVTTGGYNPPPPQPQTNFQITKNVLNRTLGQNVYVNNVEAQAQDMVEFEIRVQANNNYNYNYYNNNYSILLRDSLPYGLSYITGSTRVNGNQVSDGITQNGINLNGNSGQEQVVRFLATVNQGQTSGTLTNQAFATMNGDSRNAYASVTVRPRGNVLGAADVVTGPEDTLPIALSLGFATALLAYYFMFYRKNMEKLNFASGVIVETAKSEPKKKTEFEKMIDTLRSEEKSPDA